MAEEVATKAELEEVREMVAHDLQMAEENNRILKRMQHWSRITFWAKVMVWCIVLAVPILIYTWLAPIIKLIPAGSHSVFGVPSPGQIQQGLDQYKAPK
jgi:hypothetical protein